MYTYEPYLAHHGILGMKWGVRRYQNKDGSLTSAGERRYGIDTDKVKEVVKKNNPKAYWNDRKEQKAFEKQNKKNLRSARRNIAKLNAQRLVGKIDSAEYKKERRKEISRRRIAQVQRFNNFGQKHILRLSTYDRKRFREAKTDEDKLKVYGESYMKKKLKRIAVKQVSSIVASAAAAAGLAYIAKKVGNANPQLRLPSHQEVVWDQGRNGKWTRSTIF